MNYLQKKKLAFMSIVNMVKGFLRTITGALPLTLGDCVDEKSITDYKLYGNSVQNGTPTPDNPVEVESFGDKTPNLINWDYILSDTAITKVENGYYSEKYFVDFQNSHAIIKHLKSVLKPDVTYTFSRKISIPSADGASLGLIRILDGNAKPIVEIGAWGTFKSTTFSLTQEQIDSIYALNIYFYNKGLTISEIQLTESDTVLPYEPYGYKIPITVSGKNLFNINTYGEVLDELTNPIAFDLSKLDVGTMITISTKDEYYYKIANTAGAAGGYLYNANKHTFTLTQAHIDLGYLFIINSKMWRPETKENLLSQNVQIEYGSTATDYEPYKEPMSTVMYLDEPLYKVGDYVDYIDFENGKVVRNVGKSQYDENDDFEVYYLNSTYCGFYRFQTDMKKGDRLAGFCNYLQNRATYESDVWLGANTQVVYLFFRDIYNSAETNSERVQNFKDWLANLETPFYVYYPLATPTETPISLPNIPTFKGASVISADTTIQPSNAEIKYYSNVKE